MIHSHNCLEHLIIDEHEWTEPHGERCYQAWWECAVCGQQFTQAEADRLYEQEVLYNMPTMLNPMAASKGEKCT